jgi:uncharacterized protein (DUF488 family)
MSKESELIIYTIGHSTRSLDEFIELLTAYKIGLVIDVRTVPRSRHNPQFNKETLPASLKSQSIRYIHLPEIGGLRHPKRDSINLALKNASFRGYADYMQTKEFSDALLKLITLARENCLTIMCAEALPWRCHRNLISDALVTRRIKVLHIISKTDTITHELNEMAHVEGYTVTYPLYTKEKAQKTLGDFGTA